MPKDRTISRRNFFRTRIANAISAANSNDSPPSSVRTPDSDSISERSIPSNPTAPYSAPPIHSESPHPSHSKDTPPHLPELQQSILDDQTLQQVFTDIDACTKVLQVIPKQTTTGYIEPRNIPLDHGYNLITQRKLRALQIRYLYDNAEWWDTVISLPQGFKIVRIKHDTNA